MAGNPEASGRRVAFGIMLKITAVLLFTTMFACVKATADVVPPGEAVFFRSFFTLVPVFAYVWLKGDSLKVLRARNPVGHAWRGGLSALAMVLNFTAVGLLPLADVIAIGYAMPMFTTIFAALLIGEVVRGYRWAAIVIGLVGVLIIMWPRLEFLRGDVAQWGALAGALSAVAAAALVGLGLVVVRMLVSGESTASIVFHFALYCSAGSLLTLPFGWTVPDPASAAILVLAGLSGGTAQLLLTESIRHADMSTLAPFEYVSMLATVAIAYLLFAEVPTAWTLGGASLVIGAGLLIVWRERRLAQERKAQAG
ncbi:MAG: hypothetical protein RLZ98_459 [Pseudomonadota bacterium]|jgi:drug/metabolite transporter (DMT)-like permease